MPHPVDKEAVETEKVHFRGKTTAEKTGSSWQKKTGSCCCFMYNQSDFFT
jgi:hypothetical protein